MTFRQFAYRNITRNKRAYSAYFLSSTFAIFVFFSFAICLFHPSMYTHKNEIEQIAGSLIMAEVAIVFFSFFFILYSMNAFLKARRKEFGVLITLGISKKQLNKLLFLENTLVGITSIICGLILGILFSNFFLQLLGMAISTTLLYFYIPIQAFWTTISVFLPLFLFLSFVIPFSIRETRVQHLLRKKRKKQYPIILSAILCLIAFICLYRGYYLAYLKTLEHGHYNIFGEILLLVSLGTYLLFKQGSVFLLHILTKKRSFYMRKTNMVWISNLSYRVRDHATMLFIVTMLSAVAFTAISTLYSLKTIEKIDIETKYPFSFTYAPVDSPYNEQLLRTLESSLNKEAFTYDKFATPYIRVQEKDHSLIVLANTDYNQLAQSLHRPLVPLQEQEAHLVAIYRYYDISKEPFFTQSTIVLPTLQQPLHVTGITTKNILAYGIGTYVVLVHDDTFSALQTTYPVQYIYNYNVKDWEKTTMIAKKMQSTYPEIQSEFTSAAYWLNYHRPTTNLMIYIGTFIGVIFFVAAGSFLYFRLYTDLNKEKNTYYNMSKIGLSYKEMKKAATIQLALLFFLPFILASVHTFFALRIPEQIFNRSLLTSTFTVLAIFGVIQLIYFFLIRSLYIRHLSRYMA